MNADTTIHLTWPRPVAIAVDHATLGSVLAAYGDDVPPGTGADEAMATWAAAPRDRVLAAWNRRVGEWARATAGPTPERSR